MANNSSITLAELSEKLYKHDKIIAGRSVISRALNELNLRYKKLSLQAVEKHGPEVLKKKEFYLEELATTAVKDLIFIDECGANLQMVPRYGRAYGAERAVFSAPYQRGNLISIISAISIDKIEAAMYGQWATNGEIFKHFIENDLLPILKPSHVIVMDNVKFHQSETIKELINSVGARVLYLPPYHPELNPIEEMWSKIKCILRKLSARDLKSFKCAIKSAYEKVTQSDLLGWFKHAGY